MMHRFISIPRAVLLALITFAIWEKTGLDAAELKSETVRTWNTYVQAVERRIEAELKSQEGFLAMDFQQPSAAAAERRAVLAGGIPVVEMTAVDPEGERIRPAGGMIHHWRGSVFVPGIDIHDVLSMVANPGADEMRQEDVLASRVLERSPGSLRLYLKLRRSKLVTVVYNTEHRIQYRRNGEMRASSRSVATRIAELEDPNSTDGREKPEGRDRGFLWRLNSYWRYQETDGGVIVECESISLSRSVPLLLESMIRPMIDAVAHESMHRTLASLRGRWKRSGGSAPNGRIATAP